MLSGRTLFGLLLHWFDGPSAGLVGSTQCNMMISMAWSSGPCYRLSVDAVTECSAYQTQLLQSHGVVPLSKFLLWGTYHGSS